ncbi:hypothetical protein GUJ93_ZPchr0006g42151 [Zizania palustris]|uniref:Uncharacterized protein n=1 Tax=Zizania palustris TaxID=103762 RepID=A0A8J5SRG0_ZIZPA|nr:hypothetical protein GUJ93_ZPchr0006g42151 [Zizania palustris]
MPNSCCVVWKQVLDLLIPGCQRSESAGDWRERCALDYMRKTSRDGDQGRVDVVAPLWHPAAADKDYPEHSQKTPLTSSLLLLISRQEGNKHNPSSHNWQ